MNRLWEVDALRGMAIGLMVIFHAAFDLNYLNIIPISIYQGGWLLLQRVTISLFLLLAGASLYLKSEKLAAQNSSIIASRKSLSVNHSGLSIEHSSMTQTQSSGFVLMPDSKKQLFCRIIFASCYNIEFAKRALFLFVVALAISLATWLVVPQQFIAFGIIHFIALSTIAAIPFLRFYKVNLLLGIALLASSLFFSLPQINTPLLLWLGFTFPDFQSLDYVPLFPWFGLILIGISAAKLVYKENKLKIKKPQSKIVEWLCIAGKDSLWIYLLHQLVLLGLLKLYTIIF